MENKPREDVKGVELVEISSNTFKTTLTPSNIKVVFMQTRIWPLDYDALLHDMDCSQAFDANG